MTNPPRVVSSWVSWLITIVLSLTSALAHATTCDVDADGDIDRKDFLAILADIGERASGPNDPRDADRNGRILSNDAQLCARRCTLPLCAIPTNKAPIAKNDAATTALNTPVRINVIANDRDRDGRIVPSTVSIVTKPKHGKVTNHRNGKVTYSPARGFRGRDSFRYRVKDNDGATSNVATVTVTVRPGTVPPSNVPPVANNDSAATAVNTPVTINVVANDTDANGNNTIDPATVAIVTPPANGTAVNNFNGTITYTPSTGFFGTGTFTYNVKDTLGAISNTATVTVGVNATPAADAGPDANAVTGQPVTLDGSGSSDPNGDMITFSWRFLLPLPSGSGLSDTDIVNRTSPAPSFTPDVDGAYELELTVTDPGGLSDTDTVVITAATANVAPNADAGPDQNAEVLTLVNLDGAGSSDPDNGPVTPLTFQWSFVSVPLGSGIDETDLQPDANSTQPSFTPDEIGLYRLTLTVSDGDLTDTDDVDIKLALPNVPPNANAGADFVVQLGPPAETATLDGTGSNDSDNGPVTPLTFQWTFVSVASGSSLTNGDIQNANTDTASFTPDAAGMYTLQLRVFDGLDEAFDEVMVKANAAPVAVDDAFDVDEDTPLTVAAPGVLTNDTDANNDALTAVLNTGPSDAASFTLNPDGSFDYTPNPGFSGEDSFTYHANDDGANGGNGADSNVATVTITVNEVNDAPVAVDDGGAAYTTNEDGGAFTTAPSVLTNDTDEENDPLTAVLNTGPTNASAFTLNPDGTFSYTPNPDFFGTDTFTYHATDGNSPNPDSNVATVTITVDPVNDAPSFGSGGNVMVLEDAGLVTVNHWATGISAGPTNESGQTLVFNITGNTAPGLFAAGPTVSPSGDLTFTPALNAFGSATITLELQDNGGTANGGVDTSGSQSFTITVLAVNDPPVATAKSHQTHSGIRVTIGAASADRLKDGATDVDDPFTDLAVNATFTSITPAGATIVLSDAATGTFTYNPPAGFSGAASFQFQVCDDGIPTAPVMCSAPATVSFTVTGPDLWFVDDSAGAGGTGRLTDPFDALSDLPAGRSTGDRIFVFTGTYGTGHTLFTNEHLIGQGSSGTFDSVLGVTVPGNGTLDTRPALGGTRPQLNGTVTLAGNSTVRGLNIASTTATGLSGGAVAGVSVSEASVTSTTGTAVNLNGTGGTVSLTTVSANGAANGIVLQNTTGSFTVDGDGTNTSLGGNGSGGQISNTTGADGAVAGNGVYLDNVQNVSLRRMNIHDHPNFGIRGFNVNGFNLQYSTVNSTATGTSKNGTDAATDEGSIYFGAENPGGINGLVGTATITNCLIEDGFENNFKIANLSGTLSQFTMTGTTMRDNSTASPGNNGFEFRVDGTANITADITTSTFTGNRANGIQVSTTTSSSGTVDVEVGVAGTAGSGGTFTNNNVGVNIGHGGSGTLNFDVHRGTYNSSPGLASPININLAAGSGGPMSGSITNNAITNANSLTGPGIRVTTNGTDADGSNVLTIAISNNNISQVANRGIEMIARDGNSDINATVSNNTVQLTDPLAADGIRIDAGTVGTDTTSICAVISGNDSDTAGTNGIRTRNRFAGTTFRLPSYGGAATDPDGTHDAVIAHLASLNPLSSAISADHAIGNSGFTPGGAACPTP